MRGLRGALIALCAALPACDRTGSGGTSQPSRAPRNVLLITLDAGRADRLGCYGYSGAKTPTLDGLAKSGVLFERAYTQAPITLPAHASILTGLYPREIGLRDNGRGSLAAGHETLASIARQAGLKTAAFVSNLALARRFGLARGFDLYDDDVARSSVEAEPLQVERTADVVTDRALSWLKSNAAVGDPFCCWVHYNDAREPHEPPPDYRADAQTPYDGELAFVDAQIKRLTAWLDDAKRADDTLIIVVGAYGQPLGEHGESGAALLLHETSVHVPWIVVFPGVVPAGRRMGAAVELTSLLPTVCGMLGWQHPAAVRSTSLVGALLGAGDPPSIACYAENGQGFSVHRWAEQRALIDGQWKYISSTKPELYNLSQDAGENTNVLAQHADVGAELERKLRERYAAMTPGDAAPTTSAPASAPAIDIGAARRIGDEFLTAGAPDPKDMLPLLERFGRIPRMLQDRKHAEAIALLEELAAASPGSPCFQRALGDACVAVGRVEPAIAALKQAVQLDPGDPRNLVSMGDALVLKGEQMRAADHYTTALALDAADVETHVKLARVAQALERDDAAIYEYEQALSLYPRHVEAAMELINLEHQNKVRPEETIAFFERLVSAHPRDPGALYGLGLALASTEKYNDAITRLNAVLALDPQFGHAYNKLGICAAKLGRTDEALAYFGKAKSYAASRAEAWFNTGVALGSKSRTKEAIEAYEQALVIRPAYPGAIAALVRLYGTARDMPNALRVLRAGVVSCPADVRIHATLADVLSSCNDPALRNGTEALAEAQRAVELVGGRELPGLLATLAAAQAETGDFPAARVTAAKARQLAEKKGNRELAASIARQLAGYERGQAYRNPAY